MNDRVAETFLSMGLQSWGQSEEKRKEARDAYLTAAGFDPDSIAAAEWLQQVLSDMRWGKFKAEAAHLRDAIKKRKAA